MSEACHLAQGSFQGIFAVVIRKGSTNEQRSLLGHPGQILDMTLPDPGCGSGLGAVPCNAIFWLIRDQDSNQDGIADARDDTILYVSDLAARSLSPLSPPRSSVLDGIWNERSGEVLLQVQPATGGDRGPQHTSAASLTGWRGDRAARVGSAAARTASRERTESDAVARHRRVHFSQPVIVAASHSWMMGGSTLKLL